MTDEGRADITGGADKAGPGGVASGDAPDEGGETGVRETGDISGATSTHAGAGGNFDNTGGTAPRPRSDRRGHTIPSNAPPFGAERGSKSVEKPRISSLFKAASWHGGC